MKRTVVTWSIIAASAVILNGCTMYNNAKILSDENANIAVTINKDLSQSLINTHTGERLAPCVADIKEANAPLKELIKRCYPEGHDPNGEIIASGQYTMRKGSYCYTAVLGNSLYVFCQPPLNLGFPQ